MRRRLGSRQGLLGDDQRRLVEEVPFLRLRGAASSLSNNLDIITTLLENNQTVRKRATPRGTIPSHDTSP